MTGGEPPLDQLLASGVVVQRKYVRRQRNAEEGRAKEVERKRTGSSVLELPLLRGVLELLL
jgi:hypothetical protein